MTAGIGTPPQNSKRDSRAKKAESRRQIREIIDSKVRQLRERFAPLVAFWTKINNDWIFNWAAGLAYTLLTSIFPILLVILALGGFILGTLSLSSLAQLESVLASGLPGGASGAGGEIVNAALQQLNRSAGFFLLIGVLGSIIAGSGLFLSLESVFGIVFRLKGRDPIPQRIMAISMVLLYVVLVPIIVLASVLPATILGALHIDRQNPGGAFLIELLGLLIAFVTALVFFGSIYFIVPNRRMRLYEVWPGTLLAAILLVLFELAFPIYEHLFLQNSYGSIVGFIIVVLTFFYYLAFILLLGAEINSMVLGLRPTTKPLSALLQELQARDLMIEPEIASTTGSNGAAKQTPPDPEKGAPATNGSNSPTVTADASSKRALATSTPSSDVRAKKLPMTIRQQTTLGAIMVLGAILVVPMARLVKRLIGDEE